MFALMHANASSGFRNCALEYAIKLPSCRSCAETRYIFSQPNDFEYFPTICEIVNFLAALWRWIPGSQYFYTMHSPAEPFSVQTQFKWKVLGLLSTACSFTYSSAAAIETHGGRRTCLGLLDYFCRCLKLLQLIRSLFVQFVYLFLLPPLHPNIICLSYP